MTSNDGRIPDDEMDKKRMDGDGHAGHGSWAQRGANNDVKKSGEVDDIEGTTPEQRSRFGRMFDEPTSQYNSNEDYKEALKELGSLNGSLNPADTESETSSIPAGFAFFGQFVDHDITFDPTSELDTRADLGAIHNARTPGLDLDSVYGSGPEVSRFLYGGNSAGGAIDEADHAKLITSLSGRDLPRNHEDTALTGDPRNDENLILSQIHLSFLKFHNLIVEMVEEGEEDLSFEEYHISPDFGTFEKAQAIVRRHYHSIVLEDFLPRICQEDLVEKLKDPDERIFYDIGRRDRTYMPIEFSGAAYRYGHSQIREQYDLNNDFVQLPMLGPPQETNLRGFRAVPEEMDVKWSNFFSVTGSTPQMAAKIDTEIPRSLFRLPAVGRSGVQSLPTRNLLRGSVLNLPSGEEVAGQIRTETDTEVPEIETSTLPDGIGDSQTPLWYYILKEAEETDEDGLGVVGSRIVSEVIVGLLESSIMAGRWAAGEGDLYHENSNRERKTECDEFDIRGLIGEIEYWSPSHAITESNKDHFRLADLFEAV